MRSNPATPVRSALCALGIVVALTTAPARAADPGNAYWWDGFAVPSLRFVPHAAVAFVPQLVVGGDFSSVGTTIAEHVALWDGTLWTAMGRGVNRRNSFSGGTLGM